MKRRDLLAEGSVCGRAVLLRLRACGSLRAPERGSSYEKTGFDHGLVTLLLRPSVVRRLIYPPYVWSLAACGSDVYLAGDFGGINGLPSYGFGVWHGGQPPAIKCISRNGQIVLAWPRALQNAVLESSTSPIHGPWAPVVDVNWEISETAINDVEVRLAPASLQSTFYRLRW